MAQTAWPFPATPATVQRWARMARLFSDPCVVGTAAQNAYGLTVSGLTATIGRGTAGVAEAWGGSFFHTLDAADWIEAVPANTAANPRVDRIVLHQDVSAEVCELRRLQGTAAVSPVPPVLVQAGAVWQLPLHRFTVPANSGAPLAGLVDERVFRTPGAVSIPRAPVTVFVDRVFTGTVAQMGPGGSGGVGPFDGGSLVIPYPGQPNKIATTLLSIAGNSTGGTSNVPTSTQTLTIGKDNGAGGFVAGTSYSMLTAGVNGATATAGQYYGMGSQGGPGWDGPVRLSLSAVGGGTGYFINWQFAAQTFGIGYQHYPA